MQSLHFWKKIQKQKKKKCLFKNIPLIYTGWIDKIVVLKKTTLQLYFKTLLKKSIQVTWLCSRTDI